MTVPPRLEIFPPESPAFRMVFPISSVWVLKMPPPEEPDESPLNVLWLIVRMPMLKTPPPWLAELPLTVLLVMISVPPPEL